MTTREPMRYSVRDEDDEIVGTFDTEDEAFEYGSHLANAEPNKLYAVYGEPVVINAPLVRDPESWQAVAREGRRFA